MATNPPINLIANPDLAPETVTIYPGVTLGRGARIEDGEVVFDGTSAPFVSFALNDSLINGHTYGGKVAISSLTGSLRVTTDGTVPKQAGLLTDASETPASFTFEAQGDEENVTVTGDLHNCTARFRVTFLGE